MICWLTSAAVWLYNGCVWGSAAICLSKCIALMSEAVRPQVCRLIETFTTQITLVRFLSGMDHFMSSKVMLISKCFITHVTLILCCGTDIWLELYCGTHVRLELYCGPSVRRRWACWVNATCYIPQLLAAHPSWNYKSPPLIESFQKVPLWEVIRGEAIICKGGGANQNTCQDYICLIFLRWTIRVTWKG